MGGGSSSTTRKQTTIQETYTAAAPGTVAAREVGGNIYTQSGGVAGDVNVQGSVGLTGQQYSQVAQSLSRNISEVLGQTRAQVQSATDQSRAATSAVQTVARSASAPGGNSGIDPTVMLGVAGVGALALLYLARR